MLLGYKTYAFEWQKLFFYLSKAILLHAKHLF